MNPDFNFQKKELFDSQDASQPLAKPKKEPQAVT